MNTDKKDQTRPRVAIIYPFLHHYRFQIFNTMCHQEPPNPMYSVFSDVNGCNDINVIDFQNNQSSHQSDRLRWFKLKNIWIAGHLVWQKGILRVAYSKNYDSIIFLGSVWYFSTWVAAIVARIKGKRVLMWTHGYIEEERNLKGWLRGIFYKLAHGLLLYGNRARDILLKRQFQADNLYVVYNSLDYKKQAEIFNATNAETLKGIKNKLFKYPLLPVILFIGRLTPQKKIHQVLQAMKVMNSQGFRTNFLLVGDGPEREHLLAMIHDLDLIDQVEFFGPSYHEEELGPLIMLSDLCVAPGEVGLTCMHAFAYGTPVITHDDPSRQMPEFEAIEPGSTGALFRYGDIEDLAYTIQEWFSKKNSREEIRKKCRAVINTNYNPDYQISIFNRAVMGLPATIKS